MKPREIPLPRDFFKELFDTEFFDNLEVLDLSVTSFSDQDLNDFLGRQILQNIKELYLENC